MLSFFLLFTPGLFFLTYNFLVLLCFKGTGKWFSKHKMEYSGMLFLMRNKSLGSMTSRVCTLTLSKNAYTQTHLHRCAKSLTYSQSVIKMINCSYQIHPVPSPLFLAKSTSTMEQERQRFHVLNLSKTGTRAHELDKNYEIQYHISRANIGN